MQKTKPELGCANIIVADTGFVFSISFLVFNSENISILSSTLSYHYFM
jgi:hypothetical protein